MIPAGSKVFVIGDGVLHALNFETLAAPSTNGRRYWIEDVAVTTASSIRMLFPVESRAAPDCERAFVDRAIHWLPAATLPAPRCGHGNQAGTSALSA